jgi:hypothetical protein
MLGGAGLEEQHRTRDHYSDKPNSKNKSAKHSRVRL